MPLHRHPADRLRAGLRMLRPSAGAVANARDAVAANREAAEQRSQAAQLQARAAGPGSWTPLRLAPPGGVAPVGHAVQFWHSDAELVGGLASYVAGGLADGEASLVIATAPHQAGLRRRLTLSGLPDPGSLLVPVDAEDLLRRFLRDGRPQPGLFEQSVGDLVGGLLLRRPGVRAFGEMVGLLVAAGNPTGALQLEQLWGALQARAGFPLLCAYPSRPPTGEDHALRDQICACHTHLAAPAA